MPNGAGVNSLVGATSIGAEGKMALGMSKAELRRYAAATSERDAGIAQQELNVALEDGILEPHERIELNLKQTGRLLHQNSNSAAGAGVAEHRESTYGQYKYYRYTDKRKSEIERADPVDPIAHRIKDDVTRYTERALGLHDARKGQPVVFPLTWHQEHSTRADVRRR